MAKALDVLLNKLCGDLGFMLTQDDIDRITSSTECSADEFTEMVFRAEGMDPDENLSLRRQVRRMFTDRFGGSVDLRSFGCK